jgi:hypothetical protein
MRVFNEFLSHTLTGDRSLQPRSTLGVEKACAQASACSKLSRHAFDLIEIPRRHFRQRGTKREALILE